MTAQPTITASAPPRVASPASECVARADVRAVADGAHGTGGRPLCIKHPTASTAVAGGEGDVVCKSVEE